MIKESYYYYYQCSSIDTCNLILHRISVTSVQSNWTKCIAAAAPSCKVPTLYSGPAHVLPQLSKNVFPMGVPRPLCNARFLVPSSPVQASGAAVLYRTPLCSPTRRPRYCDICSNRPHLRSAYDDA